LMAAEQGKPILSPLEQIKSTNPTHRTVACHALAHAILMSDKPGSTAADNSASSNGSSSGMSDVKGMTDVKAGSGGGGSGASAGGKPKQKMGLPRALIHFGTANEFI